MGRTTQPAACVDAAPFSCAKDSDAASRLLRRMRSDDLRALRLSAESNARTGFFIVQSSLQLLWGCASLAARCSGDAALNVECAAFAKLRMICSTLLGGYQRTTINHIGFSR